MKIYNTMTRRKEEPKPIEDGILKIYVCGPTVYNFFHIGNARPFVVFDTLRKYLEYRGYKVKFVQNFTDVDDKIIKKAIEEGVSAEEISTRYIKECKKDMADMLDYIDKLEELDTSGIEPMSHVFPVNNVFRDDVVTNGDGSEATLANAPVKKDGGFKVPKTIGE